MRSLIATAAVLMALGVSTQICAQSQEMAVFTDAQAYGRLEAINLDTRKVVWTNRERAPVTTGALSTAGGIVFNGSIDRTLKAYDDSTGTQLWQIRMNDVPNSAPISYSVNGKQYVAVVVGHGALGCSSCRCPIDHEGRQRTQRSAERESLRSSARSESELGVGPQRAR